MGWQLFRHLLRQLTCTVVTHPGNCRKNHEDNFFLDGEWLTRKEQSSLSRREKNCVQKTMNVTDIRNRILAVSDGMGGHENGEDASLMAVEALGQFARRNKKKAFYRRRDKYAYIESFQKMIRETNEQMLIIGGAKSKTACMGATLSGLILFAREAVPFNIGDSAVYLLETGSFRKLTVDDAVEGNLTRGRRLTKYFGMPLDNGVLTATISEPIALRKDQIFLIASDGLTDSIGQAKMVEILKKYGQSPKEATAILLEQALAPPGGGRDNITIIVLKVR